MIIKILLAEKQKASKMKYIFGGVRDGLLGHMGKYQGK